MPLRTDALNIFKRAVSAANGRNAVREHWDRAFDGIDLDSFDRVFLISVGKAAASMAACVADKLKPRGWDRAIVLTKHGHAAGRLRNCDVFEAAHPVPDEAGERASIEIENLLRELNGRDLLIAAISGGASALMTSPAVGLTLADKQETTNLLLRAGADIGELNCVRKHLSRLKGGRFAAMAYPAQVVSLILSDVIGDPVDVIASGPTAPDRSTYADAVGVLKRHKLWTKCPAPVRRHLERAQDETPKPRDPIFRKVRNVIVGSNRISLGAASQRARELGYEVKVIGAELTGEARELGERLGRELRNASGRRVCLLAGGESTVHVRGNGKGGRAQELALAAAMALEGVRDCVLLSAGTDGTDGPTDAAGAIANGATMQRARRLGIDPLNHLNQNDAYTFFDALGDLVKTGPTGTNVMDVIIGLRGGE